MKKSVLFFIAILSILFLADSVVMAQPPTVESVDADVDSLTKRTLRLTKIVIAQGKVIKASKAEIDSLKKLLKSGAYASSTGTTSTTSGGITKAQLDSAMTLNQKWATNAFVVDTSTTTGRAIAAKPRDDGKPYAVMVINTRINAADSRAVAALVVAKAGAWIADPGRSQMDKQFAQKAIDYVLLWDAGGGKSAELVFPQDYLQRFGI